MSGKVFTLAVWHIVQGEWWPLATSPSRELVELLHGQLENLVPVWAQVVEVPSADDDAVHAALAALPLVPDLSTFGNYLQILELLQERSPADSCAASRPAPVH